MKLNRVGKKIRLVIEKLLNLIINSINSSSQTSEKIADELNISLAPPKHSTPSSVEENSAFVHFLPLQTQQNVLGIKLKIYNK